MAAKRGKRSSTTGNEAADRARDVVLERVEAQMQMVVEAVTTSREETRRDLTELEARLSDRIGILESAVRQNSADIRLLAEAVAQNTADIKQNSADIKQNSADIKQNSADIKQNSADIKQNSADIKQNTADIRQNSADIVELRDEIAGLRRDFERRPEPGRLATLEERVARVETRVGSVK